MNEYIEEYIKQGFSVFPCNNDKTPTTKNGFHDASNDKELLKRQFYRQDMFIGLPTGKINGIIVVDFDINKKIPGTGTIDTRTVEELKEEVEENYGPIPDTFVVETPSGGLHYYYLLIEKREIRTANRFLNKNLSIDLKGEGGYVIAPDNDNYCVYDDVENLGIANLREKCAPLPEWITSVKKNDSVSENLPDAILPESEILEIRSALSYINSDDRDDWIKIGMALKSTGSLSAYGLWNEWSKTSDKYNPSDMEKRWNGFKPNDIEIASIFFKAKKYGWVTTYKNQEVIVPEISLELLDKKEIKQKFKKEPFPEGLLNPGGLVGEIAEYILSKSFMEQPVFALSSALCAVGTLAGRKVQTQTGIRTNIYCLNIGKSGCGKDGPRKVIKELFYAAKLEHMASVENLASDSAIVTQLNKAESQIFLLDEIGRFIETTNSGAPHLKNIIDVLLKLYSSANQTFYGKVYADEDKKIKIVQPNLCLLGTTVPDKLYKGLKYENITDGFLSRMLVFETDNNRPRPQRQKNFLSKPDQYLIDKIKYLSEKPINCASNGNVSQVFSAPNPQIVSMNENAEDILLDFENYIYNLREELEDQNRIETIYNRVVQSAEQIALIVAVGNNIDHPQITEKEMMYGVGLAKYLADHMLFVTENYVAKNDYEHEVKRILTIIREAGCITYSEITKKTQNLQGYTRNDILDTLITSEEIKEHLIGSEKLLVRTFTPL
ncbi:MAG: bifunctional DNA primase/polymerase [Promethearchaeota archaeon]